MGFCGPVKTRKGQDWENRRKSFQSEGYLTATKEQKQKSSEGRKMGDGSKNPDLILKTFSNPKSIYFSFFTKIISLRLKKKAKQKR